MNGSELELWRGAWKTSTEPGVARAPFEVRREVMRQQWNLRAQYILGLVWAAGLLAFSVYAVRRGWQTDAWAAAVWLTTCGATAFLTWNWRTLWADEASSTSEFVDIYEKRCQAGLLAVRFGYYFLGLQLTIVVPWLSWDFYRSGLSGSFGLRPFAVAMGFTLLLTLVIVWTLRRSRRKTMLELERLKEFRNSLLD